MTNPREIFDRKTGLARRARAMEKPDYPDFLDDLIAQELVARLDLIERKFAKCLVLGQLSQCVVDQLAQSSKLGNIWTQKDLVHDSEWLPIKDNSLDCVIAPTGFETLNDLPGAMIQINRALKPDGLFLAAMFGGNTLAELRHVWLLADDEISGGASPRVAPFADVRQSGNLLQRAGFALPVSDMDTLTIRYDSALELMKEVKAMGLANILCGRSRGMVGKIKIARVIEIYKDLFSDEDGRVRASVAVNFLAGWCPHESQQKPLEPGSAKVKFADVLSVSEKDD